MDRLKKVPIATKPIQLKWKTNKINELRLKVWNIHGLKQSKLSKIINKSDKFLNDIFRKSDFVIFTKTWSENCDGELFTWHDDKFEEIIRKNGQRTSRRGRDFFQRKKKFGARLRL